MTVFRTSWGAAGAAKGVPQNPHRRKRSGFSSPQLAQTFTRLSVLLEKGEKPALDGCFCGHNEGFGVESRTSEMQVDDPLSTEWHGRLCPASGVDGPAATRVMSSSGPSLGSPSSPLTGSPGSTSTSRGRSRPRFSPTASAFTSSTSRTSSRSGSGRRSTSTRSYLFIVLHFPIYDKTVQRLNAAELDVFLGPGLPHHARKRRASARHLPLPPLRGGRRSFATSSSRRRSGYLLYHVLDDLFDYCFPILDKIGHKLDAIEDELEERRSEEIVRDISDAKQEIIAYRKIIKPERATLRLLERHTQRFLPAGPRALLRRHRRRGRAHLGPPRQLQGGRRGARGHERVDHLAPPAVPAPASHRRQRDPAAAHADREHLRDEHACPRRGRRRGRSGSWSG